MSDRAEFQMTYIGTATVLLELGGLRILTDPVFDPPGHRYRFGWGTASEKTEHPAVSTEDLGPIDLILLSHDQHQDNLDESGRQVLVNATKVLTTVSAAKRLKGNTVGMKPWQSLSMETPSGVPIRVTSTPARHGPPLSRPFVGPVTGFMIEWPGRSRGALYISGDTVWFRGIKEIGRRFPVTTALLHVGSVRFPLYGPLRFTLNGAEAARVAEELGVATVIPIHYEGWKHFQQGRSETQQALSSTSPERQIVWLEKGTRTELLF